MRSVFIICFLLLSASFAFGQDGSNMSYLKPGELNVSHVGRRLHIDFYRPSKNWFQKDRGPDLDKISLEINGRQIEFIEHREDDGFNNWFSGQYLETADKKVRIREFKLLKVEKKIIVVTGYFNIEPFEQEFMFKKSDIAEALLKANNN